MPLSHSGQFGETQICHAESQVHDVHQVAQPGFDQTLLEQVQDDLVTPRYGKSTWPTYQLRNYEGETKFK